MKDTVGVAEDPPIINTVVETWNPVGKVTKHPVKLWVHKDSLKRWVKLEVEIDGKRKEFKIREDLLFVWHDFESYVESTLNPPVKGAKKPLTIKDLQVRKDVPKTVLDRLFSMPQKKAQGKVPIKSSVSRSKEQRKKKR